MDISSTWYPVTSLSTLKCLICGRGLFFLLYILKPLQFVPPGLNYHYLLMQLGLCTTVIVGFGLIELTCIGCLLRNLKWTTPLSLTLQIRLIFLGIGLVIVSLGTTTLSVTVPYIHWMLLSWWNPKTPILVMFLILVNMWLYIDGKYQSLLIWLSEDNHILMSRLWLWVLIGGILGGWRCW